MLIKRSLSYCLCFVGLCMTALPTPIQASKNIDPTVSKTMNSKQFFTMSTSSAKRKHKSAKTKAPKPTEIEKTKLFHNIYKSFPIKLANGQVIYIKDNAFRRSIEIASADHKFLEEYIIIEDSYGIDYNYYKMNHKINDGKVKTVHDHLYNVVVLPKKIIYNYDEKFYYEYKDNTLTLTSKYTDFKVSYTNNNGEITVKVIDQGEETSTEIANELKPVAEKIMFFLDNFGDFNDHDDLDKKIIDTFIIPKE